MQGNFIPLILEKLGTNTYISHQLKAVALILQLKPPSTKHMKTLYTLALVLTFTLSTKAQWVTIPDAAFATKLQQLYPSCMNGNQMDTTCSDIVNATVLDVSWLGISNLYGVQFFDNLNQLNCNTNPLTNLPSLPSSLTDLNCGDNQLSSLPSLPSSLTTLNCAFNPLTNLPSLPSSLTDLDCNNNQLTNLPSLPSSLTNLFCYDNQLSSLPSLPSSLTDLRCSGNQLSSLPILPSSLTQLICHSNSLTSLPSLSSSLTYLECNNNQLSSLPSLPSSLTYLSCYNNQLSSLPSLPSSLAALECYNNQLSSLPSLPSSLIQLWCYNNQLSSLPALPQTMNQLLVHNNPQLTCLPPLNNITSSNFSDFNISNTAITCLPNVIQHPNVANFPAIDTMPICDVINANNCTVGWTIQGTAYFDIDNNCATTSGNIVSHNMKVKLLDASNNLLQQVYTNGAGNFSFNQNTGTYNLQIDTSNLPYSVLCPQNNNLALTLNTTNPISQNNNFQLVCEPGFDVGVTSVNRIGGLIFPGQQSTIRVKAGDIVSILNNTPCNTNSLSGVVKVKMSGPAQYISPAGGALTPTISNDTLIYSIADFSLVNAHTDFVINMLTDTTAQAWQQVCFEVWVTPTAGDNNTSNNYLAQCFTVINSYDPNIKEVSPQHIEQAGDWLTYTIHFQNTGTAPAFNIRVKDTLSSLLDWASFQLLDYSHEVFTQIFQNGIVHFNFLNIMLPDSMSNPEGSKGYVQFKIKTQSNLLPPINIPNTAAIYFDFNEPIITNTVNTLYCVPETVSVSFTLCPGDTLTIYGNNYSASGTYQSIIQYPNQCDTIVNISIAMPLFDLSVQQTQGTLTANQFADSYQWINCENGQAIAGADEISFTPTQNGTYAAMITIGNCTEQSECKTVLPDNIDELHTSNFTLYPNPAQEVVHINTSCTNCTLSVVDIQGRVITTQQLTNSNTTLSTATFAPGIYFIELQNERVVERKKLVVSKN